MRLFVSIQLPYFIRTHIIAIENELKEYSFFEGRFVNPENIHVTVAFIGDVPVDKLPQLQSLLSSVVFSPFEICTSSLTVHPSLDKAHVLWIDVVSPELSVLSRTIQNALSDIIKPDDRAFVGHLTLARIKKVTDYQKLELYLDKAESLNECFTAHEFLLRSSVLSSDGPVYSTLAIYKLRA